MEERWFNLFKDNPTLITHCPICSLRYDPLEAKILEGGENAHLVHIKCRRCQSAILVLIVVDSLGISSIGLITDLSGDDILKFKTVKPISYDDVIETHQFLNKKKVLIDYFD